MDQVRVNKIDDNFQVLLRELELSPRFYRLLQNNNVFSKEQFKIIKAESTTSRRKARLLTLLRLQDPDAVDRFCDVPVDTDQRALERLLKARQHKIQGRSRLYEPVDPDSQVLETGQRQSLKTKATKLTGEIKAGLRDENFVLERLVGGMLRTRAQALEEKLLREKIRGLRKLKEKNMLKELQAKVQALEKELNDFRAAQEETYKEKEDAIRDRDLAAARIVELEKTLEEVVQERDFMRRERDAAVRAEWLANSEKAALVRARNHAGEGDMVLSKAKEGAPPTGSTKKRSLPTKMKPPALRVRER